MTSSGKDFYLILTENLRIAMQRLVSAEYCSDSEYNPDELSAAWDTAETAAQADPNGTWEVFRFGTNEEFASLVNCLSELGEEFESDAAHGEIMRLAKERRNVEVMEQTKAGFGDLFDKFWNEALPVAKARTFNQVMQGM